jgi:glyoxylase-like metal-dependent hydrolase (beta-lactamase superfamily II)
VGDIRITFLVDGTHVCDPCESFPASTPSDWAGHLDQLDQHGRLLMPLGAFLVEAGERVMLVDLGFGNRHVTAGSLEWSGGSLLADLATTGKTPADVDTVVYTHLHLDHVGWTSDRTTAEPSLSFSNANHVMLQAEWDHWNREDVAGGPAKIDLALLPTRLQLHDGDASIAPGVQVVPTPGHTPGHCSVVISSGAERAIIVGDVIHTKLHATHPEWSLFADVDPAGAERARVAMLEELEKPNTTGGFAHFPGMTFGRVLPASAPKTWVIEPVPYG